MAIADLTEPEFVEILQSYLTPSSPIQRLQALRGRQEQVTQITRAFHSPGRHVFIHGDRGVGKSSLALSVGNYLCADGQRPIQLACNGETFYSIMRNLAGQLLSTPPLTGGGAKAASVSFSGYGFPANVEAQLAAREVPEPFGGKNCRPP